MSETSEHPVLTLPVRLLESSAPPSLRLVPPTEIHQLLVCRTQLRNMRSGRSLSDLRKGPHHVHHHNGGINERAVAWEVVARKSGKELAIILDIQINLY
jgi:hypothetical protein